jgi:hypothetical protein
LFGVSAAGDQGGEHRIGAFSARHAARTRVYPEMRLRLTLKSTRTAARKRAQGFPRPGVRKIAEQFQVDPSTVQKISARVIFCRPVMNVTGYPAVPVS